ncbi:MAG: P-loop NTPase fold protein [Candidatus Zixiibacteriota bacterium]
MVFKSNLQFDIYEQRWNGYATNIDFGTSKSVADYVNSLQSTIFLNNLGSESSIRITKGNPPFTLDRFKVDLKIKQSKHFSLILSPHPLVRDFYLIDENSKYALITSDSYDESTGVQLIHYYAYFVAITLLQYHCSTLHIHGEINNCPLDHTPNKKSLLQMIKRAHLCELCEERIKEFERKGINTDLIFGIRKILHGIAKEYNEAKSQKVDKVEQKTIKETPDFIKDTTESPDMYRAVKSGKENYDYNESEQIKKETEQTARITNTINPRKVKTDIDLQSLLSKDINGNEILEIDLWKSVPITIYKAVFPKIHETASLINDCQNFIFINSQKSDIVLQPRVKKDPNDFNRPQPDLNAKKLSIVIYDSVGISVINPYYDFNFIVIEKQDSFRIDNRNLRDHHILAYFIIISILKIHGKYRFEKDIDYYTGDRIFNVKSRKQITIEIISGELPEFYQNVLIELKTSGNNFDIKLAESLQKILDKLKEINKDLPGKIRSITEIDLKPSDPEIARESISSAMTCGITENNNPEDALDYVRYGNALGDLITNKNTETPLTIGICGPWGRGKTALLKFIKDRIEYNGELTKSDNDTKHTKCKCIKFNAWEHSKADEIWVGFYTTILKALEKDLITIGLKLKLIFNCTERYLI